MYVLQERRGKGPHSIEVQLTALLRINYVQFYSYYPKFCGKSLRVTSPLNVRYGSIYTYLFFTPSFSIDIKHRSTRRISIIIIKDATF